MIDVLILDTGTHGGLRNDDGLREYRRQEVW